MDRIDTARAAQVLTAVLAQPGGAAAALPALGEFAGVQYDAGRERTWRRAEVPPSLTLGDWTFAVTASASALEVRHSVRGVVLSRAVQPAAQAAPALATALAEVAEREGPDAVLQVQAWLDGWSELLGIAR